MASTDLTDRDAAIAVFHFRTGLVRGAALAIVHADSGIHAQTVDQAGKVARCTWPGIVSEQRNKFGRACAGLARKIGIGPARRSDVRQDKIVQGIDPVLQRNLHQSDPSEIARQFDAASEETRIARAVFAHRLSEHRK